MSGAIDEPGRDAGLRRLRAFASSAGVKYTKSRNFDFGPLRHGNVSGLSPYLRHRLVLEHEVLETVLARHDQSAADKFVEEVFWRAYFKGWLEHRPAVWNDYCRDLLGLLRDLDSDTELTLRYRNAVDGNTGIDCFDAWVEELLTTGYLHNHARMWFASIWVYTLELPWQLGADFFYRHLIDGDPASNTLSWRWVCGLHTRGKTYLTRVSNVAKYTDNRFNPEGQLATRAPALVETRTYSVQPLPNTEPLPAGKRLGLLVTEEDCCPERLSDEFSPVTILGALATPLRSPLEVGQLATKFAFGAVADAVHRSTRRFGVDGELYEGVDWPNLIADWAMQHQLSDVVTPYAPVGPVAELLTETRARLEPMGIGLVQLKRPYDAIIWPYATRGFFNLKKRIPSLLDELAIANVADSITSVAEQRRPAC